LEQEGHSKLKEFRIAREGARDEGKGNTTTDKVKRVF